MDQETSGNDSVVTEFCFLLGLCDPQLYGPSSSSIFLLAYVATVGGNFSIWLPSSLNPNSTPPCTSSGGTCPCWMSGASVSLSLPCWGISCPITEAFSIGLPLPALLLPPPGWSGLLPAAVCASDRYLAICQPLTYSTRMSWGIRRALASMSCVFSFTNALTQTVAVSTLSFCGPNVINHFYCDLTQLFRLSCSSIQLNEQLLFVAFMGVAPLVLITVSYGHVAAAVLRIRSAEGRKKAFSTCGSHLPWWASSMAQVSSATCGWARGGFRQRQRALASQHGHQPMHRPCHL